MAGLSSLFLLAIMCILSTNMGGGERGIAPLVLSASPGFQKGADVFR